MKLPVVIVAALSIAVLDSCSKPETPQPQPERPTAEQPGSPDCGNSPDYCPACGMG